MYLDLHNLIKIELINEPQNIRRFYRHTVGLGVFETSLLSDDEVDIKITFVDKLKLGSSIELMHSQAAYDDESFYKITPLGRKICLSFENFEPPCKIVCEIGTKPIELLEILDQLTQYIALKKKAVFIHSAAVFSNGRGILFPGWSAAGKTAILLKLLNEGAQYMSNDSTILKEDGTMLAYPVSLDLNEYYHKELLEVLPNRGKNMFSRRERALGTAMTFLGMVLRKMPEDLVKRIGNELYRIGPELGKRCIVPYLTLYPQGKIRMSSNLDIVFLLARSGIDKIEISKIDAKFAASKIAPCLSYETAYHLRGLYHMFRFAYPNKRNELVENAERISEEIMGKSFEGKQLYYVKLPIPYHFDELFTRLAEYL